MKNIASKKNIDPRKKSQANRGLFSKKCEFLLGCTALEQLPNLGISEVAFVGRSNVGKSSLINALVNMKSLARTSNTPGRTREINFFCLGKSLILADLPGYGYARASKEKIRKWTLLVNNYLSHRAELRRIFVLIDARHGIKQNDIKFLSMLDKVAQSYQLILTKCDKLNKNKLSNIIVSIESSLNTHTAALPEICITSSKTGEGISNVRSLLSTLVTEVNINQVKVP